MNVLSLQGIASSASGNTPRSVAFSAHRLAGILLQESWTHIHLRHLSNPIEWGNSNVFDPVPPPFSTYFSTYLLLLTFLLLVFIIPIILDFLATCLPTEGGLFALSSLPLSLRSSPLLLVSVMWRMTEMKQLRQGHIPFSLQPFCDIPVPLTVMADCHTHLYETPPGLCWHSSSLIALTPVPG